ncbi:MAG: BrnA antitoxin family protein [Planctomycetes bacterium]|nr:BrnA antitoxin family protein [Planctomycetota bacterium]
MDKTVRHSAKSALKAIVEGKSRTDWERVKAMKDEDIDLSNSPELDDEFFKNAKRVDPPIKKKRVTTYIDETTLEWFKNAAQGRGYQTMINQVLHEYVDAQERNSKAI